MSLFRCGGKEVKGVPSVIFQWYGSQNSTQTVNVTEDYPDGFYMATNGYQSSVYISIKRNGVTTALVYGTDYLSLYDRVSTCPGVMQIYPAVYAGDQLIFVPKNGGTTNGMGFIIE